MLQCFIIITPSSPPFFLSLTHSFILQPIVSGVCLCVYVLICVLVYVIRKTAFIVSTLKELSGVSWFFHVVVLNF